MSYFVKKLDSYQSIVYSNIPYTNTDFCMLFVDGIYIKASKGNLNRHKNPQTEEFVFAFTGDFKAGSFVEIAKYIKIEDFDELQKALNAETPPITAQPKNLKEELSYIAQLKSVIRLFNFFKLADDVFPHLFKSEATFYTLLKQGKLPKYFHIAPQELEDSLRFSNLPPSALFHLASNTLSGDPDNLGFGFVSTSPSFYLSNSGIFSQTYKLSNYYLHFNLLKEAPLKASSYIPLIQTKSKNLISSNYSILLDVPSLLGGEFTFSQVPDNLIRTPHENLDLRSLSLSYTLNGLELTPTFTPAFIELENSAPATSKTLSLSQTKEKQIIIKDGHLNTNSSTSINTATISQSKTYAKLPNLIAFKTNPKEFKRRFLQIDLVETSPSKPFPYLQGLSLSALNTPQDGDFNLLVHAKAGASFKKETLYLNQKNWVREGDLLKTKLHRPFVGEIDWHINLVSKTMSLPGRAYFYNENSFFQVVPNESIHIDPDKDFLEKVVIYTSLTDAEVKLNFGGSLLPDSSTEHILLFCDTPLKTDGSPFYLNILPEIYADHTKKTIRYTKNKLCWIEGIISKTEGNHLFTQNRAYLNNIFHKGSKHQNWFILNQAPLEMSERANFLDIAVFEFVHNGSVQTLYKYDKKIVQTQDEVQIHHPDFDPLSSSTIFRLAFVSPYSDIQ